MDPPLGAPGQGVRTGRAQSMPSDAAERKPVLVTGTHRSGTTWVGQMLALSSQAHYVHEPFAPMHERAWAKHLPSERFLYLRPEARGSLEADLRRIADLQPPWVHIARRAGGPRNGARVAKEALVTSMARRRGARALIKDPFALLLAEWIEARADADVVVLVRHPAGFASSIKRLNWRLDTRHLLGQANLMQDHLGPFQAELESDSRGETDIIEHAALVWRVLNSVVREYESRHPAWAVLRYEDLARDPVRGFSGLSQRLGIPWSDQVERQIRRRNDPKQGAVVAEGSKGGTDRDSARAMWTWTQRLSAEEIDRLRRATADVAGHWYRDDDWVEPSVDLR